MSFFGYYCLIFFLRLGVYICVCIYMRVYKNMRAYVYTRMMSMYVIVNSCGCVFAYMRLSVFVLTYKCGSACSFMNACVLPCICL
jgi:hypothetical protein